MFQQGMFLSIVFQSFVGTQPNTIAIAIDLTHTVASPTTGSVSLILRALRFGTKECYIWQRTIAAVFAFKKNAFADSFC